MDSAWESDARRRSFEGSIYFLKSSQKLSHHRVETSEKLSFINQAFSSLLLANEVYHVTPREEEAEAKAEFGVTSFSIKTLRKSFVTPSLTRHSGRGRSQIRRDVIFGCTKPRVHAKFHTTPRKEVWRDYEPSRDLCQPLVHVQAQLWPTIGLLFISTFYQVNSF